MGRRGWRRAGWAGLGLLALGTAGVFGYGYVAEHATPAEVVGEIAYRVGKGRLTPAPPPAPAPTRDGRWRQDLASLGSELPRLHANAFHSVSRGRWEAMVSALSGRVPELSDAQLTVGVMELVAAVGDGHTSVENWPGRLGTLPLRLRWFGPELRVVAAEGLALPALGLRVTGVGGVSVAEAVRRALRVVPHETRLDGEARAAEALTTPEVQGWLGLRVGEFTFARDGQAPLTLFLAGATGDWHTLDAPRTLADLPEDDLYWYQLLEGRTLYLRFLRCADAFRFANLTRLMLADLDRMGPGRRVTVDLRGNGGGDSRVMAPLLAGLRERGIGAGGGRLAILTDRFTYSSAMLNALELRRLGGRLYGEAPGENLTSYGEVRELRLPNSGLTLQYATRLFRLAPGETDGPLLPDVPATLTFADFRAGRDPVLAAALTGR